MSEPFENGVGLVGGKGELRLRKRRIPPLEHRVVLRPFEVPEHIDEARAFYSGPAPVEVEIGFGRSHFLRDRILQAIGHRFLGFELRRVWLDRVARFCDREGLDNARVLQTDARAVLTKLLPESGVRAFYVMFPDPWWKKRHEKRRLVSAQTLEIFRHLLEPGGTFHFRTDVAAYFERVEALLDHVEGFERIEPRIDREGRTLPLTHREKKCAELGIDVHALCVRKLSEG